MTDIYEFSRQYAAEQRARGRINDHDLANVLAMIAMTERHGIVPAEDLVVDLWGFGRVNAVFTAVTGAGWWIDLPSLVEPSGIPSDALIQAWDHEYADREDTEAAGWKAQVDCVDVIHDDGTPSRLRYLSNTFVMNLMAGMSPWAPEFQANTLDLMRTAFVKSGLADLFDQVPAYVEALDENGESILVPSGRSLADATRENLPDEAAARARAFSGPAGALDQDGGSQ